MSVAQIVAAYARGWFPMDDPGEPELPFYAPTRRAVFELDPASLATTRRAVRRSLRHEAAFEGATDRAFAEVVSQCGRPRYPGDGVWLTPRMERMYADLHAAGFAHTFELWDGDALAAGIVGVLLGRAAMLESMFHAVPHAGNVLLVRTLESLAAAGCELCDIQLLSDHTERLGAREITRRVYERRLAAAVLRAAGPVTRSVP